MISMPKDLPDSPALLKQLLEQMLIERESNKGRMVHLEEKNALLRQRLFGRKSEQTIDLATPQLALFNEAESIAEPVDENAEEEVIAPAELWGKRKPLPADLPRMEVIHELPDHELTCACGCRKHSVGEEISEQLEIVPMQIRVIKHVRKVYACRGCESAPVTAYKPAQLSEKSMASPSVLAMLLTTKIRRWPTNAPLRKSTRSPQRRYSTPDLGALGYPVQRKPATLRILH